VKRNGRPRKAEANGITFRIDWVPLGSILSEPDEEGFQAECYGMCHTDLHSIEVCDGLEHNRERRTVLHEHLHQLIHCSALELPDDLEETVVRFFDSALIGSMRRNPSLWRYLLTPPPPDDHETHGSET